MRKHFLSKVEQGPNFVCSVCHRLLFQNQVLKCNLNNYKVNTQVSMTANKCITYNYLHKCNGNCQATCPLLNSPRSQLWICYTCHFKIQKGVVPAQSTINNLELQPIPLQLACLNTLEQHLIALHIPFMKLLALPKGGQNGVHGPVTCVPANLTETTSLLPESNMEGSLLPVKLKRKLTYKGHYEYQYVDTMKIKHSLCHLQQTNSYYKDVQFNPNWSNQFPLQPDNAMQDKDGNEDTAVDTTAGEDESLHDRQQHCMYQDTCLMPVDIGQEILDQYYNNILHVAPSEGNNPVKLLNDHSNEAKCFPVLFPNGTNTFHTPRDTKLTLSQYINARILNADGRFAKHVEYIFFAQYISEIQQVISSVSIALRKGKKTLHMQELPNNILTDDNSLKQLLEFDDGYRFLKPIRGTPSFWQGAQRDLVACVRQLGIPTWFCSFSSADLRWTNLLQSILTQQGRTQTLENLQWAERCELLRSNPVTAARMFDYRWHIFLNEVLMSPLHPIGIIKDYFYRIEFQQRGSPHVHCLFWIENAPQLDKNTDEEVIAFIDKYVTCELPSNDDSLLDTVTTVQQHSKRHAKTCKKKNTTCRFNFPRPPSNRTFISRPTNVQDIFKTCTCPISDTDTSIQCTCTADKLKAIQEQKSASKIIMSQLKTTLSTDSKTFDSVNHLFQSLGLHQDIFESAYKNITKTTQVVLKRRVNEVWINQYNRQLLKCWNANLDIQYVVNAYACIVYIISYISKAEKEMGLLLANAQREASKQGNMDAKDALKKLGSVYLHNRDVCAQEAVYRTINLKLKQCSRKVVFIPTGDNLVKMSLPLKTIRQKATSKPLTTNDIWMTNIVDRYKNRPNNVSFNKMCLATFASDYRVLYKNENAKEKIALSNSMGYITKRTRTQPAVIRYARFSQTNNPEKFFQSLLQLFLPYRQDVHLKPPAFTTYEQFYSTGHIKFTNGSKHSVKTIVDHNRNLFERDADTLEDVQSTIDINGILEDAWCDLCPQQQLERLQCKEELQAKGQYQHHLDEDTSNIPDLTTTTQLHSRIEKNNNILCRSEGLTLIRSLNTTQMSVFLKIRQWCLDKAQGQNPAPFHLFITGGAGTGKSHLVKAVQYEAQRLLASTCSDPDTSTVLLTAPTGIAAYNLRATTIHNTFCIKTNIKLPYTPLGEDKLNTLRSKYASLQILIIDEISMVDNKLLTYIHGRLRQIKQCGDFSPFGNISVIAVGDFFQLPPVKGKPLYINHGVASLWSNLFQVTELTTIVRQNDDNFAQLLNRLRTRTKATPMLESDILSLKQRETGEDTSALHIYPTNDQVNEHNLRKLLTHCSDHIEIKAQDYEINKKTGKLELKPTHHSKVHNTCLTETLHLGKHARVMLTKNIDVLDGLVNGVCGTVTDIVRSDTNFPKAIYVTFDDINIGHKQRQQTALFITGPQTSTAITPEEETVTNNGGLRRQFPLKLAWACTVHKVQGITVDTAVISLKKIFAAGQAYVALSRVKSLSGLIIQDFDAKAIYCKENIQHAINEMAPFETDNFSTLHLSKQTFSIFLMNVQNLARHIQDLKICIQHLNTHYIAITETWLPDPPYDHSLNIDKFDFHSFPRSCAYTGNNPTLTALQHAQHGGVGLYTANHMQYRIVPTPQVNLECLLYNCLTHNILIAVIYRPPSYPIALFKKNLHNLLDYLTPLSNNIVIMGDFNEDVLKSSSLPTFMSHQGYTQLVQQPTTEKGTLIDHIYAKTNNYSMNAQVIPTYFSDHEAVICTFNHLT